MMWAIAALAAAVVAVVVGGGFGRSMWRRRWTIADTPTSDAAHVFVGTNEVIGRAIPLARPIVAPYSAVEAVWYRSLLEKEVKKDGSSSWSKVSDETSSAPFWIEDDSGRVLVRPDGAAVYATDRRRTTHSTLPERHDSFSLMRQLDGAVVGFSRTVSLSGSGRHRSTEWIIHPGEQIYVLGDADLRDDVVALEFVAGRGRDGRRRDLLVAAGDERRAASRTLWQGLGLFFVVLAGAVAIPAIWHWIQLERDGAPTSDLPDVLDAMRAWMLLAGLAVVAAVPLLYVVRLHNRLVDTRNRVSAAWGLLDVQLRRRHDLVPALAEVVGAAADHERFVQAASATARSQAASTVLPDRSVIEERVRVDAADKAKVRELLARAEAYPELRVDENHRVLMAELASTEDAIAFARTFYNDAVTIMRDRRQQLPGSLLAWAVPVPELDLWEPDAPEARPADAPPPDLDEPF